MINLVLCGNGFIIDSGSTMLKQLRGNKLARRAYSIVEKPNINEPIPRSG